MSCSNCGNELPAGVRFCPKCGAPAAPATAPVYNAPPTSSFGAQPVGSYGTQQGQSQSFAGGGMAGQGKKSGGCAKALVIVLVIGLVLVGAAGGIGYYAYRALGDKLKSSEAYTVAISTLKSDPTVADKMGTITDTGFPLGAFHEDANGTGDAAYHLSVKGTKANGTYDVEMSRRAGKWFLNVGRVKLDDGEVINVKSPTPLNGSPFNSNDSPNIAPPPPPTMPTRGAGKRR